jgi:hypothetical protein
MRPFVPGESFYNLIRAAIPDFVESDYPLFVEFVTTYLRFLEQARVLETTNVFPEFGTAANSSVQTTATLGGPLYETRKFLSYRDTICTIDDFKSHFLSMFASKFPQYSYVPLDFFVRSLRQFYQGKGTVESIEWFFRVLFNEHADVYFPREDILRASDGTWSAPTSLKVSQPLFGRLNADVAEFYVGQRVQTSTGSAQVESVVTNVFGQAFNQNIIVNELTLKFDSILGTFAPGQIVVNLDSPDDVVSTVILPVISDVIVNSGGSNYAPGDVVEFSEGPAGGGGYGAFGLVSVVSNTAINGVTVLDGGDGFITGLPVTFISTTGEGATAVVQEIVYGDFLLEDGSGYLTLEQQTSDDTNFIVLEDKNMLALELLIDPFVNATATVNLSSTNYGFDTGVVQMLGVVLDSQIEIALAATDEKPFMHPWAFTNPGHTLAILANASADMLMTGNVFFSNGQTVFALTSPTDVTTVTGTATVSANAVVSDRSAGGVSDVLYLKTFTGFNLFTPHMVLKANGTGVLQDGTISTTAGSANVVGVGTSFVTFCAPGAHVRFADGTQVVVRTVVNNTFFTAYTTAGVNLSANTFSVIPTGEVTSITFQSQRYYGKIKTVRLLTNGAHYATPPAVTVDSISARAQQLFHLNPNPVTPVDPTSANNTIDVSSGITVFRDASLVVKQDTGQIQKVSIIDSGVNYLDPGSVDITAVHTAPRTGDQADLTAVVGSLTHHPGEFTTSRGFLSADKYLEDGDFYNESTYVVRVAESFDRFRDLFLRLVHPAGSQALGQFVDVLEVPLTVPAAPNASVDLS